MNKEVTIEANQYGKYSVYEFGIYPSSSVLAGQTMKVFVDMYNTLAEAKAEHPEAEEDNREAYNYFDHLPDDGDIGDMESYERDCLRRESEEDCMY